MNRILHIAASPRGTDSYSQTLASVALETLTELQPHCQVTHLALSEHTLPQLDRTFIEAKACWMANRAMDERQAAVWETIEALVADFQAADAWLFSVPMWGLGLPYPLKHYLDALIQPGLTFHYDPYGGHLGLLTDRPAGLILTRGDRYRASPNKAALDFQGPHLEALLRFIGIETLRTVIMEPTEGWPKEVERAYHRAHDQAVALGHQLAGE